MSGGAGFVGTSLAERFVAEDRVVLFDNLARDSLGSCAFANHPNLTLVKGDVMDGAAVASAMAGCDRVVHLASIAGVDAVRKDPVRTMKVSIIGTYNDAVAFAWNPAVHLSVPLPRYRAWRHQSEYLAAVPNHILPQLTHLGDVNYVEQRGRRVSPKFVEQFGPPRAAESGAPDSRHLDIATAVQTVFEETLDHLLAHTQRETKRDAVCLAGGAALNCVANGRALPRSKFRDWYIQPAAGDNGAALGAALYVVHAIEKRPRRFVMRHDRLGPSFSDSEIAKEITLSGVPFGRPKSIARATALLLSRGLIGSWFQGGAEFGPRSLGARSILADARDAAMIDKLNSRVKFREPFRPFAPAILAHRVGDYFSPNVPSPFMLFCHDVRTDRRHEVPAIVHVDGTARVQTVERDVNPLFYELIEAFDKETGVPLVLNTSFNIRGEPIVNSLKDALKCYLTTDIDFLAIGGYLLWKPKPACVEAIARVLECFSAGRVPPRESQGSQPWQERRAPTAKLVS